MAKTATLMKFFAQLNVSMNRSTVEGAMAVEVGGCGRELDGSDTDIVIRFLDARLDAPAGELPCFSRSPSC